MEYGYIRVSSKDQNEDRQYIAMREAGLLEHQLYMDKQSGKDFNRPVYRKLLRKLKEGDGGRFDSSKEYMEIMKSAKVILVSPPRCERNRDFGRVDFVTLSFYESAACYCQMFGRYNENNEVVQIGIKSACSNIMDYDEFEKALTMRLSGFAHLRYFRKTFMYPYE